MPCPSSLERLPVPGSILGAAIQPAQMCHAASAVGSGQAVASARGMTFFWASAFVCLLGSSMPSYHV